MLLKRIRTPILLLILTLPLINCAGVSPPLDTADAVCDGLKQPIDSLLDAVVGKGSQIITAGAGDVILRSDDLAVAYDSSCE